MNGEGEADREVDLAMRKNVKTWYKIRIYEGRSQDHLVQYRTRYITTFIEKEALTNNWF